MRLAFFASGGGSNVGAILDAIDAGTLRAEPVLLISDRPGCGALARAEARGEKAPEHATSPPAHGGGGEAFGANASARRVRARALGARHDSSAHAARHSRRSQAPAYACAQ